MEEVLDNDQYLLKQHNLISKCKGHQNFATVVGDIEAGQLIEVIDSHQQEDIIKTLEQQPLEVREKIEEVSVDMWGGFPKVVEKVFPNDD